jgi:hypothetical protein
MTNMKPAQSLRLKSVSLVPKIVWRRKEPSKVEKVEREIKLEELRKMVSLSFLFIFKPVYYTYSTTQAASEEVLKYKKGRE